MEKFNKTLRGYDPAEVNAFLDQVIRQVEEMMGEMTKKDRQIAALKQYEEENLRLKERLAQYERTEETLHKAIFMAQKTADQMRVNAHQESEVILEDAKRNASRIVNDALIRAEKTEIEANTLRRNINLFKRRLKGIIESQLEMVDDIEHVDF